MCDYNSFGHNICKGSVLHKLHLGYNLNIYVEGIYNITISKMRLFCKISNLDYTVAFEFFLENIPYYFKKSIHGVQSIF